MGIGDNVVDLYRDRDVYYPGGNSLNVAVLARRFGLPETQYIGLLGNDDESRHVEASLIAEGLSGQWLRHAVGPNGKARVDHDAEGDRIFVDSNAGGIRRKLMLRMDDDDFELIRRLGHVHSSCFSYIEPELPRIAGVARQVSYDFSINRDALYLRRVCPHIDIAFLSGQRLDDSAVSALIAQVQASGTAQVCVTLGNCGAVWAENDTRIHQPVTTAKVVDTMGAGDAFIAAYLAMTIRGGETAAALQHAADCAARCCEWEGAWGHPKRA